MIKKYFDLRKTNLNIYNLFLFYGKNDGLQNEVINDIFTNNFKVFFSKTPKQPAKLIAVVVFPTPPF